MWDRATESIQDGARPSPPRIVRVQIAGVSTLEEAEAAEQAGVDALGFTVRLPGGIHDGLTEGKARGIIAALPAFLTSVAITYVDNAREAVDLCRFLGVGALQLHGQFPRQELPLVRAALPHLKIIRVVHVVGPDAVRMARSVERDVDALILDTYDSATGKAGATGKVHDWAISQEVVRSVRTPVILAGGLNPANVAAAVRAVGPWAVDVHTGVEDADGRRNLSKLRDFVRAAKQV